MSASFEFCALSRQVEQEMVRALELQPRALPAELALLAGEFRGQPVELRARAHSGPRHAYARFVELTGPGLEIANMLCVARPELALPVFGADLVAVGKDTAVVVADLSPMSDDPAQHAREHAAIMRSVRTRLEPSLASELPEWARPWFSKHALCARVRYQDGSAARQIVAEMADAFVQLCLTAPVPPQQSSGDSLVDVEQQTRLRVLQRQEAYSAAHRTDDRGLLLLRRIFEPTVADRFLREVLFPQRMPA